MLREDVASTGKLCSCVNKTFGQVPFLAHNILRLSKCSWLAVGGGRDIPLSLENTLQFLCEVTNGILRNNSWRRHGNLLVLQYKEEGAQG